MSSASSRISILLKTYGAKKAAAEIRGVDMATGALGSTTVATNKQVGKSGPVASKTSRGLGGLATAGMAAKAGIAGAGLAALAFGKQAVDAYGDAATATIKLQRITGMETETASNWVEEAKLRGIGAEQVTTGFTKLSKQMLQAKNGSDTAIKSFTGLGVSMDTIKKGDVNELLMDVADRMESMKSPTDRAALATQLFGMKVGNKLMPMLVKGRKGVEEWQKANKDAGTTFKDMDDALDQKKGMREMNRQMDGIKITIGKALMPALLWVTKQFVVMSKAMMPTIKDVLKLIKAFARTSFVRLYLKSIGSYLKTMASVVRNVVGVVKAVIEGKWAKAWWYAKKLAMSFVKAFLSFLKLITYPIRKAGELIWGQIGGGMKKAWSWVKTAGGNIVGFVKSLPGKIATAASGMWNGLKSGLVSVINWVIGKWNGLADMAKAPDWVPGIGGESVLPHIDPIPGAAKGGIVERAGSILVGEEGPEILNLSRGAKITPLTAAGGASGPAALTATIPIVIDGREVARAVKRVNLRDLAAQS